MAHDKLFEKLDVKHPDFKEWEGEWERYRDVVGDALAAKTDYLPRNKFEPEPQYDFRVELSQFVPESGLAIDRLIGALYKEKPKRDFKGTEETELQRFTERATRKGDSLNQAVEEIAHKLMSYGTTRVLVNVPVVDLPDPSKEPLTEDGSLTREEEKRAGIRPFIINYKPFAVIDWDQDLDGVVTYCRIKEEQTHRAPADFDGEQTHVKFVRFLEYTRFTVTWTDFIEDKNAEMQSSGVVEVRTHDLGIVPLIVEDLREVKPFIGHSFVRYSSRADVRKFQAESDLAYDTYMHAHPFLAIWSEDELKEIGVGSSTYLKLSPGAGNEGREDVKYIDSPSSAFEALLNIIEENRTLIYRHAQVDPLGQISSGKSTQNFQASGVSRAWSFGTSEARVLQRISDIMESIENQIFEIVLRFMTRGEVIGAEEKLFKGSIQYPEEFDLSSTHQLVEERETIGMTVNSPTLLRVIDKRIAASKVGDSTADELRKINKEIDDNPLLGTMAGKTIDPFAPPGGQTERGKQESDISGGSAVSGRRAIQAGQKGAQSQRRTPATSGARG